LGFSASAIRDAIQTQLQTVAGLRCYDTLATVVNVPAAVVMWGSPLVDYDQTFSGGDKLRFTVLVLVQKSSDRAAQDALDGYLDNEGSSSIKAAVEGTLAGLVSDCNVTTATGYGVYTVSAVDYLGVRFNVEVMPT
jgi:hypothetical protein